MAAQSQLKACSFFVASDDHLEVQLQGQLHFPQVKQHSYQEQKQNNNKKLSWELAICLQLSAADFTSLSTQEQLTCGWPGRALHLRPLQQLVAGFRASTDRPCSSELDFQPSRELARPRGRAVQAQRWRPRPVQSDRTQPARDKAVRAARQGPAPGHPPRTPVARGSREEPG